ncbi:hypothetical protein [Neptuniibacter sp.]|uniref:hypothetical protein n=1 Tax=Neptuniibacter sp. TaxID=1962643 RepID=UPI0026263402|nr:hypothetical protein [Neptuniibacter sp.]MCP4597803.1 hypothetical protein [Neptuniibacter sp.]
MATLTHKLGDTLEWVLNVVDESDQPIDITNWDIRSQMRDSAGELIQELTVTKTDAEGGVYSITASKAQTATWTPGDHSVDVEYTDENDITFSTETFAVVMKRDITHGD